MKKEMTTDKAGLLFIGLLALSFGIGDKTEPANGFLFFGIVLILGILLYMGSRWLK